MTEIEAALRNMLGPSVAVAVTDPRAQVDDLLSDEQTYIARAIPKRRFEFAAGRRAARQALAQLGLPPSPITQAADRAPVWPQGVVGSITHCDTLCIAAVAPQNLYRSLGIDIEPATPLTADLHEVICTAPERHYLASLAAEARGLEAKRIFCAKEAFYKTQYPLTLNRLGFQDVTLEFSQKQTLYIVKSHMKHPVYLRDVAGFCVSACLFGTKDRSL